jgi:hypothetical protein
MKEKSFKELLQSIKEMREGKGLRRVWLINPKTKIKTSKKIYSRKKFNKSCLPD